MKSGYGQQNMQQIMQLLQLGLRPQTENVHTIGDPGLIRSLLGGAPNFYQTYQMGNALKSLSR